MHKPLQSGESEKKFPEVPEIATVVRFYVIISTTPPGAGIVALLYSFK
jgi:hypothetical protein